MGDKLFTKRLLSFFLIGWIGIGNCFPIPQGHLYYVLNGHLVTYDFQTEQTKVISEKYQGIVNEITVVNKNQQLYSIEEPSFIKLYDTRKDVLKPLREGINVEFFKSKNGFIYNRYLRDQNIFQLVFAKLHGSQKKDKVLIDHMEVATRAVPISSHEFLYFSKWEHYKKEGEVSIFNWDTHHTKVLSLKHCSELIAWRSEFDELLYYRQVDQSLALYSLKTNSTYILGRLGVPVLYLPKTDQLILDSPRLCEAGEHRVDSMGKVLISSNEMRGIIQMPHPPTGFEKGPYFKGCFSLALYDIKSGQMKILSKLAADDARNGWFEEK